MLDINLVRENPKLIEKNLRNKFQEDKILILQELIKDDNEWRKLKLKADNKRSERNKISLEISKAKKEGKNIKPILKRAKEIPQELEKIEIKLKKVKNNADKALLQLPNIMHSTVPKGKDDSKNKVIKIIGKPKKPTFKIKNHVELVECLGLADFEASAKTSGNGFYFLKGDLALLNQALIRYTIEFMQKKKYTYIEPPLMLGKEALSTALDTQEFEQTIYEVKDENLSLIGTSEHALLAMNIDQEIQENKLPTKYYSYSMCFRKEIGSHGINEKGLWRTHQFNKVEQFIFCKPEESDKLYNELQKNSVELLKNLKLPIRILEICSGDLADWKSKSSDIEVYRPTTKDYGEVTSLSNCTDYQARKANIRLVRKDGKREVLHTLNNTAIATSRVMVAILENYQNKDGSVTIPTVLQPYMFGKKKLLSLI